MTSLRPARPGDAGSLLRMRLALWPEGSQAAHREELDRFFAGKAAVRPAAVLLAQDGTDHMVGFTELAIRPYAEGCRGERVAHLEGWFVEPAEWLPRDAQRRTQNS